MASKGQRRLAVVLRVLGVVDLMELAAVAMPRRWLAVGHAWAGLGPLPEGALVGYLARSTSALYALHGATVLFVSFDVVRYRRLIAFLATIALLHGAILLGVDLAEGMPAWWTLAEGPAIMTTGAIVLILQWAAGAGDQPASAA
jgi:hypothetical protein